MVFIPNGFNLGQGCVGFAYRLERNEIHHTL
jgi:hypothetical protein